MKEIKFIDVGEGITEGHVRQWLVKDGDQVKEDQPVVRVETDKAVVNVPSPISGTVKQNVKENTDVHLGDVIAFIGTLDEVGAATRQGPAVQPAPQEMKQASSPVPVPAPVATANANVQIQTSAAARTVPKEQIATPAVRKLARDLGIDISTVTGTGPSGRVLDSDLRNAAQAAQPKPVPKFSEVLEEKHAEEVERVKMSQTRKAIARNMEVSATIPRAVHMDILDASSLVRIVTKEKPNVEKLGTKLTFLPFIIKATVEALKDNPKFNASYDHDTQEILLKKYYNIGMAAEAPDGLKVAVIKNADKKSIIELAKEIQELHKKVLDESITLDEMRDSSFTITNVGSLGGGFLSVPMINPPEVAILGVHMIKDWPIVDEGQVKVGKILPLSLSFDHRVVDGAEAVKFMNAVMEYLKDPDFLEILG
ncbi:2-oxoacid dehydrogenases acyltransferase (catalytic domain) [uncultured archaeon]|nr:2-oxoacid dehydrogenases acyltransferase (catalytic domain) [uncultured archaeon]